MHLLHNHSSSSSNDSTLRSVNKHLLWYHSEQLSHCTICEPSSGITKFDIKILCPGVISGTELPHSLWQNLTNEIFILATTYYQSYEYPLTLNLMEKCFIYIF